MEALLSTSPAAAEMLTFGADAEAPGACGNWERTLAWRHDFQWDEYFLVQAERPAWRPTGPLRDAPDATRPSRGALAAAQGAARHGEELRAFSPGLPLAAVRRLAAQPQVGRAVCE